MSSYLIKRFIGKNNPPLGGKFYTILGMIYRIYGLYLVERLAFVGADLFKMPRREAGHLFKLSRKVRYAAVSQFVSNLAQCMLVVYQ